jgi:hypothetical protein
MVTAPANCLWYAAVNFFVPDDLRAPVPTAGSEWLWLNGHNFSGCGTVTHCWVDGVGSQALPYTVAQNSSGVTRRATIIVWEHNQNGTTVGPVGPASCRSTPPAPGCYLLVAQTQTSTPIPAPAPSFPGSVSVSASTVVGQAQPTVTVRLQNPAPGGEPLRLSTSNRDVARVPPDVEVPRGATSVSFTIDTSTVSTISSVTIKISYRGSTTTVILTVTPRQASPSPSPSPGPTPTPSPNVPVVPLQCNPNSTGNTNVSVTNTTSFISIVSFDGPTGGTVGPLARNETRTVSVRPGAYVLTVRAQTGNVAPASIRVNLAASCDYVYTIVLQ